AEAALADLFQQLVRADDGAGPLAGRLIQRHGQRGRGPAQEAARPDVGPQQRFDRGAQGRVAAARLVQVRRPLLGGRAGQGLVEEFFFAHGRPRGGSLSPPPFYARKAAFGTKIFWGAEERASGAGPAGACSAVRTPPAAFIHCPTRVRSGEFWSRFLRRRLGDALPLDVEVTRPGREFRGPKGPNGA